MTRPTYECPTCGKPHHTTLGLALCCDPAAYDEDD